MHNIYCIAGGEKAVEELLKQPQASLVPMVLNRDASGERAMDLYSWLLKQGLIDITGPIVDETAKLVTAQFDFLDYDNFEGNRRLFINSPGGSVTAGLVIYDKIQRIKKKGTFETICSGIAASMGSILLVCGTKGYRGINENGRVMIHQPLINGAGGKATEISILNDEMQKSYDGLAKIIADHSGQPFDKVKADMREDRWFSAQEAVEYGLVDHIITD